MMKNNSIITWFVVGMLAGYFAVYVSGYGKETATTTDYGSSVRPGEYKNIETGVTLSDLTDEDIQAVIDELVEEEIEENEEN